jgi:hypothetical protein
MTSIPTAESKDLAFATLFKSFKFLDRAHANGILVALFSKSSDWLSKGGPVIRSNYVVLSVLDPSGILQYDESQQDGLPKYSRLLMDCLYNHKYHAETGEVTFTASTRSNIKLNIWSHQIATEIQVQSRSIDGHDIPFFRLEKGDVGSAVGNLDRVFYGTDSGFKTHALFYKDNTIYNFINQKSDALQSGICQIKLPQSKLPYYTDRITICQRQSEHIAKGTSIRGTQNYAVLRSEYIILDKICWMMVDPPDKAKVEKDEMFEPLPSEVKTKVIFKDQVSLLIYDRDHDHEEWIRIQGTVEQVLIAIHKSYKRLEDFNEHDSLWFSGIGYYEGLGWILETES